MPARAPDASTGPESNDPAIAARSWVQQVQAGDMRGFDKIYTRYFATVRQHIYSRVRNAALADDLTSETFAHALKAINRFTWQNPDIGAWLHTIARNLTADHYKRAHTRLTKTVEDVRTVDRPDTAPSTETMTELYLTTRTLFEAIRKLCPSHQEYLILRYVHDLSLAEVAQILNKKVAAVKGIQTRAHIALARVLPEGFRANWRNQ